jgi:hypothetical protein
MWSVRKIWAGAAIVAIAAGVAGCNGDRGTYVGGSYAGNRSAVDGNWTSADGVTASRFAGGTFQTTVLATGETVADGTYQMVDGQNVRINMRSALRQSTTQVNCTLVTPSNLACTGADGNQFALTRTAAG